MSSFNGFKEVTEKLDAIDFNPYKKIGKVPSDLQTAFSEHFSALYSQYSAQAQQVLSIHLDILSL